MAVTIGVIWIFPLLDEGVPFFYVVILHAKLQILLFKALVVFLTLLVSEFPVFLQTWLYFPSSRIFVRLSTGIFYPNATRLRQQGKNAFPFMCRRDQVSTCIVALLDEIPYQGLFVCLLDSGLEVLLHHGVYTSLPCF